MGIDSVCWAIKQYRKFLITVHTSPEGDALGSEVGFYKLLKKLGKQALIINEDAIPYGYDFICPPGIIHLNNGQNPDFDCLVVLDCAELKRTGEVYKLNREEKPVLNIDHHISNQHFGDFNWVDPQASSCSEMIFKIYKKMRIDFDKQSALALYTGIMTDTGSFHYANTSSFTFKAAGELLKYGIKTEQVYRNTYESIPVEDIRALLRILPRIKFYSGNKIAAFLIDKGMLAYKPVIDIADQLLSFGRSIKGIEVVVLFKELAGKNQVRVNFRSQGKVDVNKVASFFSGGGHKTASGATLTGNLKEIEKKVISKIRPYLK